MRTTLEIDNDILRLAKHLSHEREQSLGRVVSDLVRQAIQPRAQAAHAGEIPCLPRKPGGQPVTSQDVKELLEFEV